uniref:Uncharacterized protein n=1 Tax=Polysiphonia elongata TaxID=159753 RepID=A0A1Z1MBK0_9FLOR|nr:hypothetical protein [Polysiphonia elongata]ARW63303.1 hypothetical protein [Polysiphonia elongata]
MNSNNNFFLRYIKGKWFLQENLFLFRNRNQKKNESFVDFNTMNKSLFDRKQLIIVNNKENSIMVLEKIKNDKRKYLSHILLKNFNRNYFFDLESTRKGLLRSKKFYSNKKVIQNEYVYLINQNIMITIILTKNLKGKYLGIKISSYIKKKY